MTTHQGGRNSNKKDVEKKETQGKGAPQATPPSTLKNVLVVIATCVVFFGVIAIGIAISQANDRANEEIARSAELAKQLREGQDAIKKAQQDKICKNPTLYPSGYVQETLNLSVRFISAEDIVKTSVVAATDQAPQSSSDETWVRVTYTVSNKTATTLNLQSTGMSYSFPEFLIDDTLHKTTSAAVKQEVDFNKYSTLINSLKPYEVATFAYLVKPIGSIALSVGPSGTTSSCFTGWKVR